jgi:hypothetical protein
MPACNGRSCITINSSRARKEGPVDQLGDEGVEVAVGEDPYPAAITPNGTTAYGANFSSSGTVGH